LITVAVLGGVVPAEAGVISGATVVSLPGLSSGALGPLGVTPAPNNDNATAPSPNAIGFSIFFNTFGTAEYEFSVTQSGGTTEYLFSSPGATVPLAVVNLTGIPWDGFRVELGFGTGTAFVPSGSGDALDFDTPERDPAPFSSRFPVLVHDPDLLSWSGGVFPTASGGTFSFSVDVPDGLAAFHPGGLNRFTVRLTPTVAAAPEPTAMLLVSTGALALLTRRCRR
jgi:hypothetical protein